MKKIIILVLVMALCVVGFASCIPSNNNDNNSNNNNDTNTGNNNNNNNNNDNNNTVVSTPLDDVAKMYSQSLPTKIVAETKQTIASVELNCKYTLVNGTVSELPASVYEVYTQEIDTIENGGGTEVIKPLIKETTRKTEAIQGIGSRVNGGDWDPEGVVYTITRGAMAINLDSDSVTDVEYKDNVLKFTVPIANVATVLGKAYVADIASDVKVEIVTDGAVVTSIELRYSLKGNEEANLIQSEMFIKVDYTYDLEKITIS